MQEWMKRISAGCFPVLLGTGAALLYHSLAGAGGRPFPIFLGALLLVVLAQLSYRYRRQRWLQILEIGLLVLVSMYALRQLLGGEERRGLFLAGVARWSGYAPLLLVIPLSFLPRTFWGRMISGAGVLGVLLTVAWAEKMIPKTGVLILLLYLLGILAELVSRGTYRRRGFVPERYLQLVGCLMPALLALILLISTFKIPEEPMEWRWVKDAWQAVQDAGRNLSNRLLWYFDTEEDEFAIRFGGYDEVVSLSGEVRSHRREEMAIQTSQELNKVLYLAGNYKNAYTGDGWADSSTSLPYAGSFTDGQLDTLEILYAMERDGKDFEDLLRNRKIILSYRDLRTITVFQPAYTWQLEPDEVRGETFPYEDHYSSIQWEKEPRWDFSYQLRYLDQNLGHAEFREFVKRQESHEYGILEESPIDYEEVVKIWQYQLNDLYLNTPAAWEDLESLLAERADRVQKEYMILPKTLPERVYTLAEEIVASITTEETEVSDYDKLLAIEAFLNQYTYTTTPTMPTVVGEDGEPEQTVDAVDWFLFESQEGYCTHFATAAAVLARCVGIPTRYVQGYAVDMRGTEWGQEYAIYGGDAHAWAEAYLEGVGWVPMEATPSYRSGRYQYWKTQADKLAEAEKKETGESNGSPVGLPVMPDISIPEPVVPEEPELPDNLAVPEKTRTWLYLLAAASGVLLLVLLITGTYLLVSHLLLQRKYRRGSESERIRINMNQILLMLAAEGWPQEPGETLTDYEHRLAENWDGSWLYQERLAVVWNCYSRQRYGGTVMTPEEQQDLKSLRDDMLARSRKKMGILRFLAFYAGLAGK